MVIANKCRSNKLNLIDILFIAFCMFPFIIPNPVVTTNIQPYAAILGTLVIVLETTIRHKRSFALSKQNSFYIIAWGTLFIAVIVLLFSDVSITALRAVFNYYAVAIIPAALCLIMSRIRTYPERILKCLILVWFVVCSVQFFVDRSFLTSIIGGVRFSYSYRGVVGLASEPSFLGIACFYFLHMAMKFKRNQMLFLVLILIMGVVYAQSMMGILFIMAFVMIYLLDIVNTKRGQCIWFGAAIAAVIFLVLLNTVLVKTRLHQLFELFLKEGFAGVLGDVSAGNRYNALIGAITDSFGNFLLPLGYTKRIGSGYGGFLCELGFFALPILYYISRVLSLTFRNRICQILYFIIVSILLFNNTQIGNPLLLVTLTVNLCFSWDGEWKGERSNCN